MYNSSKSITPKQERQRRRHEFLLTFFSKPDKYEVKEVNGYILVRQFDANNGLWEVAIYTKESFQKREVPVGEMSNNQQTTMLKVV